MRGRDQLTWEPFASICLGVIMLCGAFAMDATTCGSQAISPGQHCFAIHMDGSGSQTRNYTEQRAYNEGTRLFVGIVGGIMLLGGMAMIMRRERINENFAQDSTGHQARRGGDYRFNLEISFFEAIRGATKYLRVEGSAALEIAVPPGVDNGSTILIAGRGQPGRENGKSGDALIAISVKPHPAFARKGLDIWSDVQVSKQDAVSGALIEVPTLDGHAKVRIPKGTVSGQILRLRGNGIVCARSRAIGNHFIRLAISGYEPNPVGEPTNDALEREFKSIFFNKTNADRERMISHWMTAKLVDRAEAIRLAIEDWRKDNR